MSLQWNALDPNNITLADETIPDNYKVCIMQGVGQGSEYDGSSFGARISSIFVIMVFSTLTTLYPVVATRSKSRFLTIPKYIYLFSRHFGTGIILATAFIHLLDPAYEAIGSQSCVGMTGNWANFSWVPAIILVTVFVTFLMDLVSSVYVERKYQIVYNRASGVVEQVLDNISETRSIADKCEVQDATVSDPQSSSMALEIDKSFRGQFAAFLILEFGILFHSIMIGLNLGASGEEFQTLYIVLCFHQAFEGLGIGARLSAIPFPESKVWWQYMLCLLYGVTTSIAIAIGLGLRNSYSASSFTVNVVSGVLDSVSTGVLIYTGLIELLARDYLFNVARTRSIRELGFMVTSNVTGAAIMALLGKWA